MSSSPVFHRVLQNEEFEDRGNAFERARVERADFA